MWKPLLGDIGGKLPFLRFQGETVIKDLSEETQAEVSHIHQVMDNSAHFDRAINGSESNKSEKNEKTDSVMTIRAKKNAVDKVIKSNWRRPFISLGGLFAIAAANLFSFGLVASSSNQATSTTHVLHMQKDTLSALRGFTVVCGGVGSLVLLFFNTCNEWPKSDKQGALHLAKELDAALKTANHFETGTLRIEAASVQGAEAHLEQLLQNKLALSAQRHAGRIRKVFDHPSPHAREHLLQVFGHRQKLPDANAFKNLFQYLAVLSFQAEQQHLVDKEKPTISRAQFLTRAYAMARAGLKTGDIYQFAVPNMHNPHFQQIFNDNMTTLVQSVETGIQKETHFLTDLFNREVELKHGLQKARKHVTQLQLSEMAMDEEIGKLETLISRLETYQGRIRQQIAPFEIESADDNQSQSLDLEVPMEVMIPLQVEIALSLSELESHLVHEEANIAMASAAIVADEREEINRLLAEQAAQGVHAAPMTLKSNSQS